GGKTNGPVLGPSRDETSGRIGLGSRPRADCERHVRKVRAHAIDLGHCQLETAVALGAKLLDLILQFGEPSAGMPVQQRADGRYDERIGESREDVHSSLQTTVSLGREGSRILAGRRDK